jgi:hypothetical protein
MKLQNKLRVNSSFAHTTVTLKCGGFELLVNVKDIGGGSLRGRSSAVIGGSITGTSGEWQREGRWKSGWRWLDPLACKSGNELVNVSNGIERMYGLSFLLLFDSNHPSVLY